MKREGQPQQLTLRVGLRDGITFDNFYPGSNELLLRQLREGGEPFLYLWGSHGSGRSHLLQALCHAADGEGRGALYLSLADPAGLAVTMLEGLENYPLVVIDDIDGVAGNREWEAGLFHLYNRIRDSGGRMVVAAGAAPTAAGFLLPDLVSRLGWGPVYQLLPLNDSERAAALQLRARRRGMELPDEVAAWLLKHTSRDLPSLFALLDELDRATLSAKRRLTIPFVREFLS